MLLCSFLLSFLIHSGAIEKFRDNDRVEKLQFVLCQATPKCDRLLCSYQLDFSYYLQITATEG